MNHDTRALLPDHPLRHDLANELHARPFPELRAPCHAAFLAIKEPGAAAERDRARDRAHLLALLDRHGAPHPPPGAGHYSGKLGRGFLKWEMHTEFVTYTLFQDGVEDVPFSVGVADVFPAEWLADVPGRILTRALVRMERFADDDKLAEHVRDRLGNWFVPESLAVSMVLDREALVAGDFRIDHSGHVRFAVLARDGIGPRRLGRIAQRLLEIETYKSASMLTLPVAREIGGRMAQLDRELAATVREMSEQPGRDQSTLDRLLRMAAEIEEMSSRSSFRFGAAGAYSTIVGQRIEALRETRFQGRQLFSEFMMRRYDPAMRTCSSAQAQLRDLSARAERAANLLRTRVDVATAVRNKALLESMDRRAALQLRLQQTVEGISVVAISYYAVSLLGYLLAPLAAGMGVDKATVLAAVALPTVLVVGMFIRRLRKHAV